jgi:hypothetical protein
MQKTILSLIAILVLLCSRASGQEAGAGRGPRLEDPVFGLVYDTAKVHYDAMPALIRRICPDFEQGTYWTYAHTEIGGGGVFCRDGRRSGSEWRLTGRGA